MANVVWIKHVANWGLDEEVVRRMADGVLKGKNLNEVELSVVFVGRKVAKDLNIKYRKMDYIPQVLAFPMDKKVLGDVVICTPKLKYEASYLMKSVEVVLRDWLEHGISNLLK